MMKRRTTNKAIATNSSPPQLSPPPVNLGTPDPEDPDQAEWLEHELKLTPAQLRRRGEMLRKWQPKK